MTIDIVLMQLWFMESMQGTSSLCTGDKSAREWKKDKTTGKARIIPTVARVAIERIQHKSFAVFYPSAASKGCQKHVPDCVLAPTYKLQEQAEKTTANAYLVAQNELGDRDTKDGSEYALISGRIPKLIEAQHDL